MIVTIPASVVSNARVKSFRAKILVLDAGQAMRKRSVDSINNDTQLAVNGINEQKGSAL
jgi:hypothetical protein